MQRRLASVRLRKPFRAGRNDRHWRNSDVPTVDQGTERRRCAGGIITSLVAG